MARVWLFGRDVDTDQIVPGRYAPYMTSEEELKRYPFIEARPEFAQAVQPGDIIVAGDNFGCGSSREYAPRALQAAGIAAVLAPSFSRIFFRNALNLGLWLFEIDLTDRLADGQAVRIDREAAVLETDGGCIALPQPPGWLQAAWAEGGIIAYYRRHGRLPVVET